MSIFVIGFTICTIYQNINRLLWWKCLLGVRTRERMLGSGEGDYGCGRRCQRSVRIYCRQLCCCRLILMMCGGGLMIHLLGIRLVELIAFLSIGRSSLIMSIGPLMEEGYSSKGLGVCLVSPTNHEQFSPLALSRNFTIISLDYNCSRTLTRDFQMPKHTNKRLSMFNHS